MISGAGTCKTQWLLQGERSISRFPSLRTEQAETTIIAWSPNDVLVKHSAEVRCLRAPSLWRSTEFLTVRIPHLLFSFLHVGKVINNGLWKIFQAPQFYFQRLQLLHFRDLENRGSQAITEPIPKVPTWVFTASLNHSSSHTTDLGHPSPRETPLQARNYHCIKR